MTEQPDDQLIDRLAAYGRWLDAASGEHLREKESGAGSSLSGGSRHRNRAARALAAVAAAVALVVGSFVVNQFGNGSGGGRPAFAWSATPADATDAQRQSVVDACTRNTPGISRGAGTETAVDIRGWLGIGVFVTGKSVTVCAAELNSDSPGSQVLEGLDLPSLDTQNGSTDMSGVQVANMHVSGHEVTVVWGRDTALPADCRNLDVLTNKGVIRALRSNGIFAFWYPGQPSIVGLSANAIQYGCAADAGTAHSPKKTYSTIAGADPFANLCMATQTVLLDHGIIDQKGRVVDLRKWDVKVHDEFAQRLTPIAEVFMPGPNVQLSDIYSAWTGVNEGQSLFLDSTGAQKLTDRPAVEAEVSNAIVRFVAVCDESRTRPEDRLDGGATVTTIEVREMPAVIPTTTIVIREMNPVVPTTVMPPG